MIPFNKPYIPSATIRYCNQVFEQNVSLFKGYFANKCLQYLQNNFQFTHCFLTASCTDALYFSALLLDIKKGDEVIVPSFCFVSVANVFANLGATIVLIDSSPSNPNLDIHSLESLITSKTKAIVFITYAGHAENIDQVQKIAKQKGIYLIEDAAHGFGAEYSQKMVGSFGDIATFSFHETKNITCGQGGLMVINNSSLLTKAETIANHGSNRLDMERGVITNYSWVSKGAEFNLSEISCAVLFSQFEKEKLITQKRIQLWNEYYKGLKSLELQHFFVLPAIQKNNHNGHIFYLRILDVSKRDALIQFLQSKGIHAYTHYEPLHLSAYFVKHYHKVSLPNAELLSKQIIRLPLYYELQKKQVTFIIQQIHQYFMNISYQN